MKIMQKEIKYLALCLAVVIVVSIFSSIYYGLRAFSTVFENKAPIVSNKKIESTTLNNDISGLDIEVKYAKLNIKESSKLKVETNNKYITSGVLNNNLIVRDNESKIVNTKNDYYVTIYLPSNISLNDVKISSGAGSVDIDNLAASNFSYEMGAGKTTVNELNVLNKTNIDGGIGKINILSGSLANLDLDMGVGKIDIASSINGDSKINAGVGSLTLNLLDDKSNYKIKSNKGIGTINIDGKEQVDNQIYGEGINFLEIDGGLGSIDINFK